MSESGKARAATVAMFSPLVIYLLALNPWFVPEQHDDVLYFFGAVALNDGDGFALGGTPITDWPPVFSAILAAAMKVFGQSVWVAKLVVLGFVAIGIALTYSVGRLHGWTAPKAIAGLTGLLPISLICGAAVLSEWPYLAMSMAFSVGARPADGDAGVALGGDGRSVVGDGISDAVHRCVLGRGHRRAGLAYFPKGGMAGGGPRGGGVYVRGMRLVAVEAALQTR